jgi:transposase InsO family protein
MAAGDVIEVLDMALAKTGLDWVRVDHRPRLLSDNGPCYISGELNEYLEDHCIDHTRGAPYHPQTQGKIERYHRTMKNVLKFLNHFCPGKLEQEIGLFVDYYNNMRYHESIDNVTPSDVYFGLRKAILSDREIIKQQTLQIRRKQNLRTLILT